MNQLSAYNSFFTEIIDTMHLSEQANEALKSEYNLDFLGITKPILEKELENIVLPALILKR